MSQQPDDNMAYIARKDCRCLVAAIVDDPRDKKAVAYEVAKWIKGGFTVERVTCDYVRENWKTCTCAEDIQALPLFGHLTVSPQAKQRLKEE